MVLVIERNYLLNNIEAVKLLHLYTCPIKCTTNVLKLNYPRKMVV